MYIDRLLSLLRQFLLIPKIIKEIADYEIDKIIRLIRLWIFIPSALISSAGIWSIPGDLCLFYLFNSHLNFKGTRLSH